MTSPRWRDTATSTCPSGAWRAAFCTRLVRICCTKTGSASATGSGSACTKVRRATPGVCAKAWLTAVGNTTTSRPGLRVPRASREAIRRLSTRRFICCASRRAKPSNSVVSAASRVTPPSSSTSSTPITAVSGVRSSCDRRETSASRSAPARSERPPRNRATAPPALATAPSTATGRGNPAGMETRATAASTAAAAARPARFVLMVLPTGRSSCRRRWDCYRGSPPPF